MSTTRVRGRSRRRQFKRTKRQRRRNSKRRIGGQPLPSYAPVPWKEIIETYKTGNTAPIYYTKWAILGQFSPDVNFETLDIKYDPLQMKFKNGRIETIVNNISNNNVFVKV